MKRILLILACAAVTCAFAQNTPKGPVTKNTNTNEILEDLKFGTGRTGSFLAGSTLSVAGTFSGTPTGGALDLSALTLTLPSTFVTTTGTQTLTGKTINLASNTLVSTADQLRLSVTGTTGNGNLVFGTSPVLTTPNIGAATGTSVNLTGGGTFGGNVTVTPGGILAGSGTNLVLSAGSSGATLTLSQGAAGVASFGTNVVHVGKAGSGTGGNFRMYDDGGTSRWLTGILGTAGERAFNIYDVANAQSRLTISSAAGATGATATLGASLTVAGSTKITGALSLPTAWTGAHGLGFEYDGALPGSRVYYGDGTGYTLRWVSRTGSATTDRMVLTDSGSLTVGGNVTLSGGVITGGAAEQRLESSATTGRVRISGGTMNDGAGVILGGSTNAGIPNTGILAMAGSTVLSWSATGAAINSTSTVKGIRTASAALDFPSVAASGGVQELTVTVTGAAVGDSVTINSAAGATMPSNGLTLYGQVTATNTVTVRATNTTGAPIDPVNTTFRISVFSF